jgi:CheY-like chemotaxis protein
MTVLIIDDNPSVRRLIQRAIRPIATEIWECEDGIGALAAFNAHRPDLILMDVRMPKMGGLAATRQILQSHPLARIVIVTDCDDEETRTAATEAGACGFASKQDLTELTEIIARTKYLAQL